MNFGDVIKENYTGNIGFVAYSPISLLLTVYYEWFLYNDSVKIEIEDK